MFRVWQVSYVIWPRLYSFHVRYHSSTTIDLIKTSSSDIERKRSVDHTLWATSETNGLVNYLSNRIKVTGPITVAEFMHEALLNPKHVYYCFSLFYLHQNYSFKKNVDYYDSRVITRAMKYTVKKVT